MDPLHEFGIEPQVNVNHADVSETSLIMATHPDDVRSDRLEKGFTGVVDVEALLKGGAEGGGLRSVSANGILGDARGATPEIGQKVLESAVEYLLREYNRAATAAEPAP